MDNGDRIQIEALRAEVRQQTSTIEKLSYQFDAAQKMLADHETRIRSTEKWKYSVPVAALAALATVVGSLIAGGNG